VRVRGEVAKIAVNHTAQPGARNRRIIDSPDPLPRRP
jgi:hypothetical protein